MKTTRKQSKTFYFHKNRKISYKKLNRFLRALGILLILLIFLNLFCRLVSTAPSSPIAWATSGMERVGQQDKSKSTTQIQLYAARGEYEPFQIIIQAPPRGLTNVNVSVSNLSGPNGQIISQKNITLYREHYVHVTKSSPKWSGTINSPLGAGWYPDALIPFVDPDTNKPPVQAELKAVPFNLNAQQNQPIWADIFVPRNTPTGLYTGEYTVTSSQGTVQGKILLNVWNFELPLKPLLDSSFAYWDVKTKDASAELLRHKIMPKYTPPEHERELIDKMGLISKDLGFWSGANIQTCQMGSVPSVNDIKIASSTHQPDLLLYNYTADEIDRCLNLYEPLKQWARNLHQVGIKNLVTMTPVPELYNDGSGTGRSAVDIWVVLPEMYNQAPDKIAAVLKKGDQVWSYNALVQSSTAPIWQIDYAPINFRIQPGFISQSLGLTGLLYWRVDLWSQDPWHDVDSFSMGGHDYPGEGMLVYPGKQVGIDGVVASMRLKWLREGVDDYEYVEILKRLGRKDWALQVGRQAGSDWQNWTRSPIQIESVRRQLGDEISRLASQ